MLHRHGCEEVEGVIGRQLGTYVGKDKEKEKNPKDGGGLVIYREGILTDDYSRC